MKTHRCTYYVNPETLHGAARLTNLNDKKRNLMRKSQSLNIVTIDKPKSSIAPIFGNPVEEEDDIEENGIEEDDFEEDTNFSSGKIPFNIKRGKSHQQFR